MNSIQLKCFLEVARELNFARAAENLHFSQPTVSKQIQSLESELKVKLFDRNTRSVSLTQAGRMFFPNARSIYKQELDALHNLKKLDMEITQRLHIGTYGLELFSYMPKIYSRLFKEIPNLQPDVVFAPYQSLNSQLQADALDLIIGVKELIQEQSSSPGNFTRLTDAFISYIVPSEFADSLSDSDAISSEDFFNCLALYPQINHRVTVPVLESALKSHLNLYQIAGTFADENVQYCDNIESAFLQVRSGNAFLILGQPKQIVQDNVCCIPIKKIPPFSYGYYCSPANQKGALKLLKRELLHFFN